MPGYSANLGRAILAANLTRPTHVTKSPPARFEGRVVTVVETDLAFQGSVFLQLHPTIARSMIHFVAAFPGEIDT